MAKAKKRTKSSFNLVKGSLPINGWLLALVALVLVVGGYAILKYSHAATTPVLWGDSFGGSSVANINAASAQWPNATAGRYYYQGDPTTYPGSPLASIPARETIFVSFKSSVATVKTGAYNATFTTILKSWNASGRSIYWTWQHEADNPSKKIATADYVAGFNQLLSVERANPSPNVHSMSIFMADLLTSGQPHGNPESWYVNTDFLGFDSYQPSTQLLAQNYATSKGKKLAFGEIGDGINPGNTDTMSVTYAKKFVSQLTPVVFAVMWYNQANNTLANLPNTLAYLKTLPSSAPTPTPTPTNTVLISPSPSVTPTPTKTPTPTPTATSSGTPTPTATPDGQAPSVPGNLHTTLITDTQIAIDWNPSTDNVGVQGYNVYRDGTLVAGQANTGYVDQGLSSATTYSYTVSAYDAKNNQSAQSPAVLVTTQPTPTSGGGTNTGSGSGTSGGSGSGSNPLSVTPPGTSTAVSIPAGAEPVVGGTIGLSSPDCSSTSVKVDGSLVSSSGSLDTSYLTNGNHTVTAQGCNQLATRTVTVQNHLSFLEGLRNTVFAGFHGNKTLVNGTLIGILVILTLVASYFLAIWFKRYLPVHAVSSNLR